MPRHPLAGGNWDLAGQDGRTAPVAFFEDLVEVTTGTGVERFEAPVVEDEELGGDRGGAGDSGRGHSGEGATSRWRARMAGSSDRSNPVRTDIPSQAAGHIPARGNPVRADILSQAAGHIPA